MTERPALGALAGRHDFTWPDPFKQVLNIAELCLWTHPDAALAFVHIYWGVLEIGEDVWAEGFVAVVPVFIGRIQGYRWRPVDVDCIHHALVHIDNDVDFLCHG